MVGRAAKGGEARRCHGAVGYGRGGARVGDARLRTVVVVPDDDAYDSQYNNDDDNRPRYYRHRSARASPRGAFALPHDWLGNWFSNRWNIAYDCALLALVVTAARSALHWNRTLVALVASAATLVAFFAVAPVLAHQTLYFPRHAAVLEVPVLLLVLGTLDALERRRDVALRAYVATYALFTLLALGVTYRGLAKAGDFERAAAFIAERAAHAPRTSKPAEKIYVFDQEMAGPLAFYYRGRSPIVPLPAAQDFTRFDARAFAFHDVATVRARLGANAPGMRLFLYRGDVCYDVRDPFGCRFLEEVVRADYRVLSARALASAEVRELERR